MEWWVEALPEILQPTVPWMLYGTVAFLFGLSAWSFGVKILKTFRSDKSGLD